MTDEGGQPLPSSEGKSRGNPGKRGLSARNRALVYLGIGTLQGAISVFLMPAYAHALTLGEFGLLQLLIAVEALSMLVLDAGMTGGAARNFYKEKTLPKHVLVSYFQRTGLSISTFLLVLIGIVGAVAIFLDLLPSDNAFFFAVAICSGWFQRINATASTIYRVKGDAVAFAALAMARVIGLSLAILLIVTVFDWGLMGIVLTRLGIYAATACYELSNTVGRRLPPDEDRDARKLVWRLYRQISLPLYPNSLLVWARSRGATFVVAAALSLAGLGLYGSALLPAKIINLTSRAFLNFFEPFFYKTMEQAKDGHLALLRGISCLFLTLQNGIALTGIAISPEVFRFLFPQEYLVASIYAPFLLLGSAFVCAETLLRKTLLQRGEVGALPVATGIAGAIGLGATFLLAQRFDLIGAVGGAVTMASLSLALLWYFVQRSGGDETFPRTEFALQTGLLVVIAVLPLLMADYWMSLASLPMRLGLLLAGGLAMLAIFHFRNRDTLSSLRRYA